MENKNRLKELRKTAGLTQTEIGKIIGFTQSHYASYERGATELTEKLIIKLSQFYDVSTDYLLGLKNNHVEQVIISREDRIKLIEALAEIEKIINK